MIFRLAVRGIWEEEEKKDNGLWMPMPIGCSKN